MAALLRCRHPVISRRKPDSGRLTLDQLHCSAYERTIPPCGNSLTRFMVRARLPEFSASANRMTRTEAITALLNARTADAGTLETLADELEASGLVGDDWDASCCALACARLVSTGTLDDFLIDFAWAPLVWR